MKAIRTVGLAFSLVVAVGILAASNTAPVRGAGAEKVVVKNVPLPVTGDVALVDGTNVGVTGSVGTVPAEHPNYFHKTISTDFTATQYPIADLSSGPVYLTSITYVNTAATDSDVALRIMLADLSGANCTGTILDLQDILYLWPQLRATDHATFPVPLKAETQGPLDCLIAHQSVPGSLTPEIEATFIGFRPPPPD